MENNETHEIDVLALCMQVLKEWRTLLLFMGVAAIIGIIVALATPREYTSTVILAPEMSSGGMGMTDNLANLASNFGFDIGSKSSVDAIYPEIYPDIFSSIDFIKEFFDIPVRKKDNSICSYKEHLCFETKFPFWQYPKIWIGRLLSPRETGTTTEDLDPFYISRADAELCLDISKKVICLVDKKTSEITIQVVDQDPVVAAIMADTLQHRLQNYITSYRTKKARTDLTYCLQMVDEYKTQYDEARNKYVAIVEQNRGAQTEKVKQDVKDLENQIQTSRSLYTQMVVQQKQAEARIQERTPAFTIIQRAYTPVKPSSRSKRVTVMLFAILGGILGAAWIGLGRNWYQKIRA